MLPTQGSFFHVDKSVQILFTLNAKINEDLKLKHHTIVNN